MVATFETETFWYFVLFCQGLSWPHAGRRQKAKNKLVTMDTIQTNRTFTYFCYRTKNRVTVCCNCRCCVVGIANKEEEKRKRSFKFYTAKLSRFSADTPRFFFFFFFVIVYHNRSRKRKDCESTHARSSFSVPLKAKLQKYKKSASRL